MHKHDKKKFLTVLNVGQGDCMILRSEAGCALSSKTIVIDTGDVDK